MESQAKYTLIGSFVVVSAILLVVALLWLSEAGGGRDISYYTVYFKKHSLDGLQTDGDVTMKGIKVGSVAEYHISPKSVEVVVVRLEINSKTPVKTDTRAVIKRNILTGIAYIDLVGSSEKSPLLVRVGVEEVDPVIPEGTSDLDKLAESIPEVIDHLNSIATRINSVLSESNVANVSSSLSNLEKVTRVLGENSTRIENVLINLETSTSQLASASKSVSSFANKSERSLKNVVDESTKTLQGLQKLIATADKRAGEVTTSIMGSSQVFSQEMSSLSQSITEAAGALSRTLEDFEDPRTIITGPRESSLGPGEYLQNK
jgi:phospholipid/cholesterol/gamma-HCH transport system substrate-binding protein